MNLSIILPTYNSCSLLSECLRSLLNETIRPINFQFEVLIIDDGSYDDTEKMVFRNFSRLLQTNEVKFIKQVNQGVSAARNKGLSLAKGDYVTFIDADDIVLENYFIEIHRMILAQPLIDIFEIGYFRFIESKAKHGDIGFVTNTFGEKGSEDAQYQMCQMFKGFSWARVVRNSIATSTSFPLDFQFCEDFVYLLQVYSKAKLIYAEEVVLYGYRNNPNSAINNRTMEQCLKIAKWLELSKIPDKAKPYIDLHVFYLVHSTAKMTSTLMECLKISINAKRFSALMMLLKMESVDKRVLFTNVFPLVFFSSFKFRRWLKNYF